MGHIRMRSMAAVIQQLEQRRIGVIGNCPDSVREVANFRCYCCGYVWQALVTNVIRNSGCTKCKSDHRVGGARQVCTLTIEDYRALGVQFDILWEEDNLPEDPDVEIGVRCARCTDHPGFRASYRRILSFTGAMACKNCAQGAHGAELALIYTSFMPACPPDSKRKYRVVNRTYRVPGRRSRQDKEGPKQPAVSGKPDWCRGASHQAPLTCAEVPTPVVIGGWENDPPP